MIFPIEENRVNLLVNSSVITSEVNNVQKLGLYLEKIKPPLLQIPPGEGQKSGGKNIDNYFFTQ